MSDTPGNTPLRDLLRSVPSDARATYEHDVYHTQSIPYGRMCQEAAGMIESLEHDLAEEREARKRAEQDRNRLAIEVRSKVTAIEVLRADLARVTAENEALRREHEALRADFTALQRAIVGDTAASAMLTVERLQEDAERYLLLRDGPLEHWTPLTQQWGQTAQQCDQTIDAARKNDTRASANGS